MKLDNHGPLTVDPLKPDGDKANPDALTADNHGALTVDPLKLPELHQFVELCG